MTLDELAESRDATIISVFERDRGLLESFDNAGLRPGVSVHMLARNYDDTFSLRVNGQTLSLDKAKARKIWVEG